MRLGKSSTIFKLYKTENIHTTCMALCRMYENELYGRIVREIKTRQRFRVLCAGNIIHADVGCVMKTRRKHGEVKGI